MQLLYEECMSGLRAQKKTVDITQQHSVYSSSNGWSGF